MMNTNDDETNSKLERCYGMAEKSNIRSPDALLAQIQDQLKRYEEVRDAGSLRDATVAIVAIEKSVRQLGRSVGVAAGLSSTSARERIKGYLEEFHDQVIDGIELAAVSGIAQYARRIRELREEGFVIRTGPDAVDPKTGTTLRSDQYLYLTTDQNSKPKRKPV